jgi:hypothetical protein
MRAAYTLPLRRVWGSALLLLLALLSACGGGGSSSQSSQQRPVTLNLPPSAASASDSNVAVVTVASGPRNNVNIPYVSVTLCAPGSTSNCKTINNVLLDTGSTGLRIFSNILGAAPALALPGHSVGASATISECAQFLTALAWGPVKVADVSIGGKTATSVPVHIMESSQPPASCGSSPLMAPPSASSNNNASPLSANGILGVSQFVNDGQTYFNCANPTTTACRFFPPANQQVQNPVALFATDNNGVLVQLPAIPAAGATSVQGYLVFGVGTRSNNQLGGANVVPLNAWGYFTTTYKGTRYPNSFMDSGSNGLFFDDPAIATSCSANGFYCPTSALPLTADIDLGGSSARVNFSIANSDTLLQGNLFAYNNLGGPLGGGMFDWGLPFFFGRSVYTVLEGKTVGSNSGPFYAFTN